MITLKQKSKLLARWLRHCPEAIGVSVDSEGWTDIAELIAKSSAADVPLTYHELDQIVEENDKKRFTFDVGRRRIRAAQGHSIKVDLKLPLSTPPPVLYHGTTARFLNSIRKNGLLPGTRHDVHLSTTRETAIAVGAQRGIPVILAIETFPLIRDGFEFRCAQNGVWLVRAVPSKYLRFPQKAANKK